MNPITPRVKRRIVRQIQLAPIGAIVGMAYYLLQSVIEGGSATPARLIETAAIGMLVAVLASSFEVLYLPSRSGARVRQLSFPAQLMIRVAIMWAAILTGLTLGNYWFNSEITRLYWSQLAIVTDAIIAFSVSMIVLILLLMRDLVGQRVFANFVLGRYFRPVSEYRIFLFLDLVDSTGLAQRLGDEDTHALISQFFFDIATPIIEFEGETHRYIGDEIVVTWDETSGFHNNNCLNAIFAIEDELKRRQQFYLQRFNEIPDFRAALHCGLIVAGECGEEKREIVYFGDTINTAARIQSLCRELKANIIISKSVKDKLQPDAAVFLRDLGTHPVRGRSEPVELFHPTRF